MELHNKPVEDVENKFVITEERAYFLPCQDRAEAPPFIEILGEIFDLVSPKYEEVDRKLSEGRITLGYFDPSTKEIDVHLPLEPNDYVQKRIYEVFSKEAI